MGISAEYRRQERRTKGQRFPESLRKGRTTITTNILDVLMYPVGYEEKFFSANNDADGQEANNVCRSTNSNVTSRRSFQAIRQEVVVTSARNSLSKHLSIELDKGVKKMISFNYEFSELLRNY